MPTDQIQVAARGVDLSSRIVASTTVSGSPAAAAETIIATVTVPGNLTIVTGVILFGFAAFTVGTSGTATRLRIRQTNVTGTTVADTGATTGGIAAANLVDMNVGGVDTAPPTAGVYVLTLIVTAGSAISTVSATQLVAIAV